MDRATTPQTLGALLGALGRTDLPDREQDLPVTGVTCDSREVRPGHLYVAIDGTSVDGHAFLAEARRRGAVAAVVERGTPGAGGLPLVTVPDTRAALARLAAVWHGCPADRLTLIGITGTVGKTSVLKMLEAILDQAGLPVGTIGTLGVQGPGIARETGLTVPGPLVLHQALSDIVRRGGRFVATEVTSHALHQRRMEGLAFDVGVFTTLVPLEHADYHGGFRDYVRVKRRFLGHLRPGAPLFHSSDDRVVRRVVQRSGIRTVACGTAQDAPVRVEALRMGGDGTSFVLNVEASVPRLDGGVAGPLRLPLRLRLLGLPSARNAALAAAAALGLGVEPGDVQRGLAALPPLERRMEMIHRGRFLVVDDGANHPDSVSALFGAIEQLGVRRVHAVYAIRGGRGAQINRRTAEALAIWSRRRPLDTLILTRSEDVVGEKDRVREGERRAVRDALGRAGLAFEERATLAEAIPLALDRAGQGDLVLLLGTQGMDGGAAHVRRWLERKAA